MRIAEKLAPADAEMVRRATTTIVNQVAAMKNMVDAFAQYAKLPVAQLRPLDINALVTEVLTLYPPERFRISVGLAPHVPPVMGDAGLFLSVIHNLLQNAHDALEGTAAPMIKVSTEQAENGVTFTVEDNGPGFPDHLMTKLFEPYATTKPKGTGLGLAIVKRIVDEHQGRIEVQNLPEGGARVSITLPLAHGLRH
jgi:nitrogen fixation/metabolism regulation signal transduction histidine kinase